MKKVQPATFYEGPFLHIFQNPLYFHYYLLINNDFQLQYFDTNRKDLLAKSIKPIWPLSNQSKIEPKQKSERVIQKILDLQKVQQPQLELLQNYQFQDWSCIFSYNFNCFYIFGKGYIFSCQIKDGIIQFERFSFPNLETLLQQLEGNKEYFFNENDQLPKKINIKAVSLYQKKIISGFINDKFFMIKQNELKKQDDLKKNLIGKNQKSKKKQFNSNFKAQYKMPAVQKDTQWDDKGFSSKRRNKNKRHHNHQRYNNSNYNIFETSLAIQALGVKLPASKSVFQLNKIQKKSNQLNTRSLATQQKQPKKQLPLQHNSLKYQIFNLKDEIVICQQIVIMHFQTLKRQLYWVCLNKKNDLIVFKIQKSYFEKQRLDLNNLYNQKQRQSPIVQIARLNVGHIFSQTYSNLMQSAMNQMAQINIQFHKNKSFQSQNQNSSQGLHTFSKKQADAIQSASKLKLILHNKVNKLFKSNQPIMLAVYNSRKAQFYEIKIHHSQPKDNNKMDIQIQNNFPINNKILTRYTTMSACTKQNDLRSFQAIFEVQRKILSMCFFTLGYNTSTINNFKNNLYIISIQKNINQSNNAYNNNLKNINNYGSTKQKQVSGKKLNKAKKGRKTVDKSQKSEINDIKQIIIPGCKINSHQPQCQIFVHQIFFNKAILLHKIPLFQTPQSNIWFNPSFQNNIFYIFNENAQNQVDSMIKNNIQKEFSNIDQNKKTFNDTKYNQIQKSAYPKSNQDTPVINRQKNIEYIDQQKQVDIKKENTLQQNQYNPISKSSMRVSKSNVKFQKQEDKVSKKKQYTMTQQIINDQNCQNQSDSDITINKKLKCIDILQSCNQFTAFYQNQKQDLTTFITINNLDIFSQKQIGKQWICLGYKFQSLQNNHIYQQKQDQYDYILNQQSTYNEISGPNLIKMLNTFDDQVYDQQQYKNGWKIINAAFVQSKK